MILTYDFHVVDKESNDSIISGTIHVKDESTAKTSVEVLAKTLCKSEYTAFISPRENVYASYSRIA